MKRRARRLSPTAFIASAIIAMMPPSPRLSARMMNTTYLSDTTRISDQNTSDSTPNTLVSFSAMACGPWKASRMVYSGLVPMSPKTTPTAATARPATPALASFCSLGLPIRPGISREARKKGRVV